MFKWYRNSISSSMGKAMTMSSFSILSGVETHEVDVTYGIITCICMEDVSINDNINESKVE